MRTVWKRLWVTLMALSLCLQLLPGLSLTARAAPADWEEDVQNETDTNSTDDGDGAISEEEIQTLMDQGVVLAAFDTEEEMLAWLQGQSGVAPMSDSGFEGPSIGDEYGIMPTALVGGNVDPGYFYFTVWSANEAKKKWEYDDFDMLASASEVAVTSGKSWRGPASGELSVAESSYPTITGYRLSTIRIEDTIIRLLGNVVVNGETHIYFSALTTTGKMTHIVLSGPDRYAGTPHPIEVRYVPEEYQVSYEVYIGDDKQNPDDTTYGLDKIFGRDRPSSTVDWDYSFRVSVPAGFEGEVKVADDETAEEGKTIYPQSCDGKSGYGDFDLGVEVKYKARTDGSSQIGAQIDTDASDAPAFFSLNGTYHPTAAEKATGDQHVRVILRQKEKVTFDPTFWLASVNIDSQIENVQVRDKVILERSSLTSTPPPEGQSGGWIGTNGLFNYQWAFTAVHPYPDVWKVDALEINGTGLTVPLTEDRNRKGEKTTSFPSGMKVTLTYNRSGISYYPYTLKIENIDRNIVITGGGLVNDKAFESVPTELTGVQAEYWNGTTWTPLVQSKPVSKTSFQISSGQVDIDHFGANLRFKLLEGYGWPGNNPDKAVTVSINTIYSAGTKSSTQGPDANGYYYMTLNASSYWSNRYNNMTYLLSIKAVPKKYSVIYLDGTSAGINSEANVETVTNMPRFNSGPAEDTNNGLYYSSIPGAGVSNTVLINGTIPVNTDWKNGTSEAEFHGWVLTDKTGKPYGWDGNSFIADTQDELPDQYPIFTPNSLAELEKLCQCAEETNSTTQTYKIYLTALWSAGAPDYGYYVTFNYIDEAGETHTRADPGVSGIAASAFSKADNIDGSGTDYRPGQYYMERESNYYRLEPMDGLSVVFDPGSAEASILHDRYLWYRFDADRSGSGGEYYWEKVRNGGEVAVWMISTLGRLDISKTLSNPDFAEGGEDYMFNVSFTLPGADIPESVGNEAEFFGGGSSHTVDFIIRGPEGAQSAGSIELTLEDGTYTGELQLKHGQTASIPLPAGTTYTVTETPGTGYILEGVTGSGTGTEDGTGQSGGITANTVSSAAFTNACTGTLTVSKTVAGNAGDTGREFHFTVTLSDSSVNGRMGNMDFTDGVASFTLKHGETAVAALHPSEREVSYEVTEEEADRYGYTTTSTGATGSILPGRDAAAEFVNTKNFSPWWPDRDPDGQWQPPEDLDYLDHTAYITGFPDGLVHPLDNLTRAQAAMIFYRLLTDEARREHQTEESPYPDVPEDAWYGEAVATLSHMGVIKGFPDGTFRPGADITRAEFVTIAVGFFSFQEDGAADQFSDIAGHWARPYINAASVHELIHGYPDGTFRPEGKITRAETISVVNNVLGRRPHVDGMLGDMTIWPDNMDQSAWYYADIQEATNSHTYSMDLQLPDGLFERWIALLADNREKRKGVTGI